MLPRKRARLAGDCSCLGVRPVDRCLSLSRSRLIFLGTMAAPEQASEFVHAALYGRRTALVDPRVPDRPSRRPLFSSWRCNGHDRIFVVVRWIFLM